MRPSTTVLGMLDDRGKRGLPIHDVYRQLFNPDLYIRAYARIYSNEGAMTPGSTPETVDGMSMKKIHQIIDDLRHERYRWTPTRRTYILKKNGKKGPLGLPMLRSYCPPYRVLSGFVANVGSDLPTHSPSTVPYFADTDECLAVSNVAERACVALR